MHMPRGGVYYMNLSGKILQNFYTIYALHTKSFKKALRCASSLKHVYGRIDRLEVLTDEQIDELLAIVEDKKKVLLEGSG
jgi:hypothetical protein